MSDADKPTLEDLTAARDDLQQQIDRIVTSSSFFDTIGRSIEVAETLGTLRDQLRQIKEIMTNMRRLRHKGRPPPQALMKRVRGA